MHALTKGNFGKQGGREHESSSCARSSGHHTHTHGKSHDSRSLCCKYAMATRVDNKLTMTTAREAARVALVRTLTFKRASLLKSFSSCAYTTRQ